MFRPNSSSSSSTTTKLKVRRPAHLADEAYAEKLALGYSLMKALPDDDPRSFRQQANIHCAYCNTVYNQQLSDQPFQVHGSWLFFPFHRWYLYFHERILASLLGDPDFALPFWNYDNPEAAAMPWFYVNYSHVLNDSRRDPDHLPPTLAAIDFNINCEARSPEIQARENSAFMYNAMIRDPTTQAAFFGAAYRRGDLPMPGYGSVEQYPHNTIHVWSGTSTEVGGKDMGSLYAAARDPIFYAHHAQLDRLWEVWKSFGNSDMTEEDFLDSEFAFYNEEAEMVRVKVRDSFSTEALGYVYEEVSIPWLDASPVRLSDGVADIGQAAEGCRMGEEIWAPCSVQVKRDPALATATGEENLILGGFRFVEGSAPTLNVFVNLPGANASTTSGSHEFVGPVMIVPQFTEGMSSANRTFALAGRIRDLNLTAQSSVVITLVPMCLSGGSTVSVDTLVMQYPPTTNINNVAQMK